MYVKNYLFLFLFFYSAVKDGPPFVSIKVIENGLRDEDFSQEYKRLLKAKIQYDTFMKRRAMSSLGKKLLFSRLQQ